MTDLTILEAAERERARGRLWLDAQLDVLCVRNGLDPWETWRKRRHLDRMARQEAVHRQLRADLAKIARPVTDALGPVVARESARPPGLEARRLMWKMYP